jgi:hypothetical protein
MNHVPILLALMLIYQYIYICRYYIHFFCFLKEHSFIFGPVYKLYICLFTESTTEISITETDHFYETVWTLCYRRQLFNLSSWALLTQWQRKLVKWEEHQHLSVWGLSILYGDNLNLTNQFPPWVAISSFLRRIVGVWYLYNWISRGLPV